MRVLALCLVLCLMPMASEAARKANGSQPISLRLAMHYWAIVNFPEPIERVMGVGKSDPSQGSGPTEQQPITIEFYGNTLGIGLVHPEAEGRVVVFCLSGERYLVNYKPGTPADDQVDVLSPRRADEQGVPFSAAIFLTALKLGTVIPGASAETLPLPGQPDERLHIVSAVATGVPQGIGWVLRVENTQAEPLAIDSRIGKAVAPAPDVVALASWTWLPGYTIVFVHVEQPQLLPGQQTRIILILERRS